MPAATRYTTDYNLHTNICTLRIDEAQNNDLGNYQVVAENKAGKDETNCNLVITKTANIDDRPYVNPDAFKYLDMAPESYVPNQNINDAERVIPPHVIIPLTDQQMNEGDNIKLICKIDGLPRPKVR